VAYALNVAERLGYEVRQDWLGGTGGGGCEIRGRKVLFIDLALSPAEQLELALDVLRHEPAAQGLAMPNPLKALLQVRKIA
jgi:hypothetical protein